MSGQEERGEQVETIGQRVRRLRLARGLSQRELSAPGISYAYVSRIESGGRLPSLKAMRLLARRLGVTLEEIETGARVPVAHERELRVRDAELELRLGRDLDRAEEVFLAVVEEDEDPALVAQARAGLGLLAARRGDHAETIKLLRAATRSGHVPPEERPDVYEALGAAYTADDSPGRAVGLFERCRDQVRKRAPEDVTLALRYSVYLGCAYSEMGDQARALAALTEATEIAEGVALPQSRIHVYWARMIVAWRDANSEDALRYVGRAISLLETTEDTLQLARAHVLCAQLLTLESRAEEAAPHLDAAEPMLVVAAEAGDLGLLRAEQAKVAAMLDRPQEALDRASEAAELLGEDARHLGLKWHALALAHAAAGEVDEAVGWFDKALTALKERGQLREAAKTARDWADVLRAAGRNGEAYGLMEEAMMLGLRLRSRKERGSAAAPKPTTPRRSKR